MNDIDRLEIKLDATPIEVEVEGVSFKAEACKSQKEIRDNQHG